MSKHIKILSTAVITALLFSGCSTGLEANKQQITIEELDISTIEETATDSEASSSEAGAVGTSENSTTEEAKKESLQRDEGSTVMAGQIVRIVGNAATIDLLQMPERMARRSEGDRDRKSGGSSSALVQGAQPRGGGGGQGGERPLEMEKTGESIELIIPVGTEIRSSGDRENLLDIEHLSSGMTLMITADSELTEAAEDDGEMKTLYAKSLMIMSF